MHTVQLQAQIRKIDIQIFQIDFVVQQQCVGLSLAIKHFGDGGSGDENVLRRGLAGADCKSPEPAIGNDVCYLHPWQTFGLNIPSPQRAVRWHGLFDGQSHGDQIADLHADLLGGRFVQHDHVASG